MWRTKRPGAPVRPTGDAGDGPAPSPLGTTTVFVGSVSRRRRLRARRMQRWAVTLMALGTLVLGGAGFWTARALLWTNHSKHSGQALVAEERARQHAAAAELAAGGPCREPPPGSEPHGILDVPSLQLLAPVEEGTDDAQLNVAVGHDPNSVWPGQDGTAVLLAHDVSYFVHIDQLHPGDVVRYETACRTLTFTVTGSKIVTAGTPVYNTPGPTLLLVTCWPTNALWFTPDRYLVTATESGVDGTAGAPPGTLTATPAVTPPAVPAPPELVSQGLTLATNSIPMGTMTLAGTPDQTWAQSPGPLAVEESAIEAFIGGLRAALQDQPAWWRALAPGVAMPGPLAGAHVVGYPSALDVTIHASGSTATSVELATTVALVGGAAPGTYHLSVTEPIAANRLVISAWTLQPAGGR